MTFNPQFQKVGDILVYQGIITEEQLQKALSEQKESKEKQRNLKKTKGI